MTAATSTGVPPAVAEAVASVSDPEYPGVSIADLGLLERLAVTERADGTHVTVGLIPTFSGCPALAMIAADVRNAVEAVPGVAACRVDWLTEPVWSVERVTPAARSHLGTEFSVVFRGADGGLRCPVCGSADVEDRSLAGPTRCRSVAWCASCRNVVEVMR